MWVPANLKEIGDFATDIVNRCSVSMQPRIERGVAYRNIFLTGKDDGSPQVYKKTYAHCDDLASSLYSPIELRLNVTPIGKAGPRERAYGHAAAAQLNSDFRAGDVDEVAEEAVLWALVKGKTLVKLNHNKAGFEPELVMPEDFGVLEEGKSSLAKQKAFFHRTYITLGEFSDRVRVHPKRAALLRAVRKYGVTGASDSRTEPDQYAATRMVMLGGLYPYQVAASPVPGQRANRGIVEWLTAPQPMLAPETRAEMVAFDEVWVWDSAVEDWVVIQMCGPDCVLWPHRHKSNIFAEYDPFDSNKSLSAAEYDKKRASNPLIGRHPFVEFCVNRIPRYFWGDSEVRIVGSVQWALNNRIDGIQRIMRKQEDPPQIISGASINQNAIARLRRPGTYLVDGSPNLKHQEIKPSVGPDEWQSLHEYIGMFNDMAGTPAVTRGEGESGVRSQGHAETLVRMASPRFKDRALSVERSVSALAQLGLEIQRARNPEIQVAWVKKQAAGPFAAHPLDPELYEPPAPNLFAIEFLYSQLGDNYKAAVDAHSASPMFSQETRALIFALARLQAISPKDVIELTHPPRETELVDDLEAREAERAAFMQAHPELLHMSAHGGRRR